MKPIEQFLSNHSISAKTASSAWLFLTGLFYMNPQFHDYVLSVFNNLPKGIHGFIAGAVVPALIFWRTQKRTTVTAEVAPGETGTAEAEATVTKS